MFPQAEPISATIRGQQAGRLAAREMIKTADNRTGGLQGVMAQLKAVGDIVARRHQHEGMAPADICLWRLGFCAGVGAEFGEHLHRIRPAVSLVP